MYGIIGYGIAGRATALFLDKYKPYVIDKDYGCYNELLNSNPDIIFICVPTPFSEEENAYDVDAILEVLESIKQAIIDSESDKQKVVIRSTIDPASLHAFNQCFGNYMSISFMPEFLRESSYEHDSRHPDRVLIGVHDLNIDLDLAEYIKLFVKYGTSVEPDTYRVSITCNRVASLTKLSVNSFLATKVSFFNEIQRMAPDVYDEISDLVGDDKRIGHSHTMVPGTHGYGFSGKCLPKDLSGLISYSERMGHDPDLLKSVRDYNDAITGRR